MSKKKAILIIDCQYDFINGSLPVPKSEEKIKKLGYHLHKHNGEYAYKIFTMDFHPWNHCSFKENGGQWPRHCLRYSRGAAIYQPLLEAAEETEGKNYFLYKGCHENVEEYSIFDNPSTCAILKYLIEKNIDELDICGLAGDICVTESIKGAIKLFGPDKIKVLVEYSPSLDDGSTLRKVIEENHLKAEFDEKL